MRLIASGMRDTSVHDACIYLHDLKTLYRHYKSGDPYVIPQRRLELIRDDEIHDSFLENQE